MFSSFLFANGLKFYSARCTCIVQEKFDKLFLVCLQRIIVILSAGNSWTNMLKVVMSKKFLHPPCSHFLFCQYFKILQHLSIVMIVQGKYCLFWGSLMKGNGQLCSSKHVTPINCMQQCRIRPYIGLVFFLIEQKTVRSIHKLFNW